MATQTKGGSCYQSITSRQQAAKDTKEDVDGMGKKDKLYYKAIKSIITDKCAMSSVVAVSLHNYSSLVMARSMMMSRVG